MKGHHARPPGKLEGPAARHGSRLACRPDRSRRRPEQVEFPIDQLEVAIAAVEAAAYSSSPAMAGATMVSSG